MKRNKNHISKSGTHKRIEMSTSTVITIGIADALRMMKKSKTIAFYEYYYGVEVTNGQRYYIISDDGELLRKFQHQILDLFPNTSLERFEYFSPLSSSRRVVSNEVISFDSFVSFPFFYFVILCFAILSFSCFGIH
jgi:hypothetical protein